MRELLLVVGVVLAGYGVMFIYCQGEAVVKMYRDTVIIEEQTRVANTMSRAGKTEADCFKQLFKGE